jgi:hypothetical protein
MPTNNPGDPPQQQPQQQQAPPPPQLVLDEIQTLFANLDSPEGQVVFNVPPRPSLTDINGTVDAQGNQVGDGSVDTFELRTGPTDVDSYHDFYRLQMAFEDVWTELTADTLFYKQWNALMDATLAQQRIDDRSKLSIVVEDDGHLIYSDGTPVLNANGTQRSITAITGAEDLQNFLDFLRQQFGLDNSAAANPQYQDLAAVVQSLTNACADLFNQLDRVGVRAGSWHHPEAISGQTNDGNWPDDVLGSSGASVPQEQPFTNMAARGGGVSRFDYLTSVVTQIDALVATLQSIPPQTASTPQVAELLTELEQMLREKYVFDIFAPNSINYGLLINYRQHWTPISYQVGNLVSTIPLAPQEVRKYTTKSVVKKTRNIKEMNDSLHATKSELGDTTRLDGEIVARARSNSNFQQNASGSFGNDGIYKVSSGIQGSTDQTVESTQTKRDFHEAVSKAAQEFRNEHKMEVSTEESREDETTSYREIRNPNDELTVTYLFYELQRRYNVTESLNKITPVILVANDVPSPHEVDSAWLLRHDWILKRAILDDSFRPALEYLSANFTGTEIQLEVLKLEVEHQRSVVDKIAQQVSLANTALNAATVGLQTAQNQQVLDLQASEAMSIVKGVFDPLGIVKTGTDGNADRARLDFAKDALDRTQTKVNQLVSQLNTEGTVLQQAIDKYVKAAKEHFDNVAEIDRLRIHVKDNIIYYMQAIWTYEPPDQRYFRLYDIDVPVFSHNTVVDAATDTTPSGMIRGAMSNSSQSYRVSNFPNPTLDKTTLKLHQVADIDSLWGFKGNYMIFPVVNFNYMNWFMMKDYLSFTIDAKQPGGGTVQAQDPDPLGGISLADLEAAYDQIQAQNPESFAANAAQYREIMLRLLENENDEIIVPSNSLCIEALPGTHPLLEDFKLIHRAVDVKKAQAEARRAELENLRLASRLEAGILGDPDVDKMVVIRGGQNVNVDTGP